MTAPLETTTFSPSARSEKTSVSVLKTKALADYVASLHKE